MVNYRIYLAIGFLAVLTFVTDKASATIPSKKVTPLSSVISSPFNQLRYNKCEKPPTFLPSTSAPQPPCNLNDKYLTGHDITPLSSVISQALPTTKKPIVVSELVEKLRTADVIKRRQIIRQLSDRQANNPDNIVPELIKALSDPDPLVKSGVAEALGNFTDKAVPAIPALIEMMGSTQRAIVPSTYYPNSSLLPIPPAPISPLPIYRLPRSRPNAPEPRVPPTPPQNPENRLRITAIAALGKIGLPARTAATAPLTQALQDPDPWVKLNATWALAEIGASTPILNSWLEAIQHPNPELRHGAATIFQDSRSLLRKSFGAEADANTATVLLAALKDDDYTVRNAASSGLELLGTKALSGLIQGLNAPEPVVRLEAAKLLGDMEATALSVVPTLVKLLKDTGRYVPPRTNQLFPFASLPALPALPLPSFSRNYPLPPYNPEKLVRVNAAIALGKIGDRQAIPALAAALKDNNPWMQLASNWALIRFGQNQGLPVIGKLLQYPQERIQREALSQLKYYGSQSAAYLIPYYKPQLDSPDDNKRNQAIMGVGNMGPAALNLVPKLRTLLVGNQKNSPGYAATILGQIARDTATAWQNGNLSSQQRQTAIREFAKVLQIMDAPNTKFNQQPRDRVRNALAALRGSR